MEICFLVYILKINERGFGNGRYNMELIGADMWPCLFVTGFWHLDHCYARGHAMASPCGAHR